MEELDFLRSLESIEMPTEEWLSKTPEWITWYSMKRRCNKPDDHQRVPYEGIGYDPDWEDFDNFYRDMGDRPSPQHSIDRKDGTKGYSKDNCHWATKKEQALNRKSTIWVKVGEKEMCLKDACALLNLHYKTIHTRVSRHGWPLDKALTTPVRKLT